jgi:cyclopropane-fatty-acyl-phospholipid synthase
MRRFVGGLASGELVIDTPNGGQLTLKGRSAGPSVRLSVHDWRMLVRLAFSRDIGAAESYIAEEWSSPHLTALLTLAARSFAAAGPLHSVRMPRPWLRLRHALNRNTRRASRRNIAAHYDLGNAFYRPWLDAGMSYSAGLFSSPDQTLESAQEAKLDRVCELLELVGGERVLEIGCGWGALAERLMRTTTCSLTGVTLSTEQLAYAQRRLDAEVQSGRCELRLQDYRDVAGRFDRVVTIEMLEAVGEAYWPTYFAKLHDSLRPGGIAVLQVITIDESRFDRYRRRPDFIQKYIFPGGMLPTKQIVANEAAGAGLRPVLTASFGPSYARTITEWRHRFEAAWPAIEPLGFDRRFKRMWDYYLAYCEAGFEIGAIDVSFFKLVRSADQKASITIRRRH